MPLIRINRDPSPKDLRLFATLWLFFFSGFATLAWHHSNPTGAVTLFGLALLVGLIGWIKPPAIRLLYVGSVYVTFPIGFVFSHVILAFVYYLVITPIGLLMRLLGRDPLQRRFDPALKTYWEPKTTKRPPADYLRQH